MIRLAIVTAVATFAFLTSPASAQVDLGGGFFQGPWNKNAQGRQVHPRRYMKQRRVYHRHRVSSSRNFARHSRTSVRYSRRGGASYGTVIGGRPAGCPARF